MKLITPDVAKVYEALGAKIPGAAVETNEQVLKNAEILAAARLADAQKMEAAGIDKAQIDAYMKNANEVMHTGNTGLGAELIPANVLMAEVLDMVPEYATFLGELPGNHGSGLAISAKVPVIGEVGFFQGNTEPTTSALGPVGQATHQLATGEVTITQGQFIVKVALSKRELTYSIVDLEALIKKRIAQSAVRTMEALILNADSDAGGTGNVNSDDGAPAATNYYMQQDHGLRELCINGSGLKLDIGTFDTADLLGLANILGDLFSDPSQCAWLFNSASYNKAQGLADFADAAKRGEKSTLAGKAITNILGADVFKPRDMGLTEADGKLSVTPGNNTKGQIGLLYKPAVQHGFGQDLEIDVEKVPGKGVNVVATFEWGFAIAQKLAGLTSSSVALGYNMTN